MANYYRISHAEEQMVGEGSWCGSVAARSIQRLYDVPFAPALRLPLLCCEVL